MNSINPINPESTVLKIHSAWILSRTLHDCDEAQAWKPVIARTTHRAQDLLDKCEVQKVLDFLFRTWGLGRCPKSYKNLALCKPCRLNFKCEPHVENSQKYAPFCVPSTMWPLVFGVLAGTNNFDNSPHPQTQNP